MKEFRVTITTIRSVDSRLVKAKSPDEALKIALKEIPPRSFQYEVREVEE